MDRDRNLLFGVFAVQLNKVSAVQLMEAAGAWAVEPSKGIPERLVAAQALSQGDRDLIQRLVDEAVAAHDGNAGQTLKSFGGDAQVHRSYRGSIVLTPDGQVSIRPTDVSPHGSAGAKSESDVGSIKGVFETPGRYTNAIEHARGGMGRVLLVRDDYLGRDIALKELLPHLGEVEEATTSNRGAVSMEDGPPSPVRFSAHILARFLQEARITGQLEHPSIVPVYELGHRADGSLYYTMKLVRGRSLSKALRECKTLEERLRYLPHFVDLCQAIAYAHSRKIIHRDIKPANVMVGEFGETVVLDWGLAKQRDREDVHEKEIAETILAMNLGDEVEAAKTEYGMIMGTPAYMPPEQARGQLDRVDERSDVYSLGIVLYELLTGKVPFSGWNSQQVLSQVRSDEAPAIHLAQKKVPRELTSICERAINKKQEERYNSAKELAEDVARFLSGALVQAYQYTPLERVARFLRKHKAAVTVGTLAVISFSVFAGYAYSNLRKERDIARDLLSKLQRDAQTSAGTPAVTASATIKHALPESRAITLDVKPFTADGSFDIGADQLAALNLELRNVLSATGRFQLVTDKDADFHYRLEPSLSRTSEGLRVVFNLATFPPQTAPPGALTQIAGNNLYALGGGVLRQMASTLAGQLAGPSVVGTDSAH